jgi:hypothetical protein
MTDAPLWLWRRRALGNPPDGRERCNAITNPTPRLFGVLQNVSVDISGDIKELHGQNQFAEAVARGKTKISCKAKFGRINGLLINDLFFGQTATSGILADVYDTTGQAIPTTPFTITVTPPSSGTWARDLGVRDANGNPMTRVAAGPVTGQYSVTAGAYLFAAADVGLTVFISYQYTATSTTAKKSTVMNLPMGAAPAWRCDLSNGFQGGQTALSLYKCISTKLGLATKLDDFLIPEMDFSAFADATGKVLDWGTSE